MPAIRIDGFVDGFLDDALARALAAAAKDFASRAGVERRSVAA